MQMPLFNNWINARKNPPKDGQKVFAYLLIENPEDAMFPHLHKQHNGETLIGPTAITYHPDWIEEGMARPLAYWQLIDSLPDENNERKQA